MRAGHHCAQPILRRYGLESAVRPSLAMYNTYAEVDLLVAAHAGLRPPPAAAGNASTPASRRSHRVPARTPSYRGAPARARARTGVT